MSSTLEGLGAFLASQGADLVILSYPEIESITGRVLPPSARSHRQEWWANGGHSHARSWAEAGFKTSLKRAPEDSIAFIRMQSVDASPVDDVGHAAVTAASTSPALAWTPVFDVNGLMTDLAPARPVFHSEADFQHAFAWSIRELFPKACVRLEVRPPGMERRAYLDIWAVIDGRPLAIELKYKTRAISTTIAGEDFEILSHGAQDLGRYDFLKDVARIERACEGTRGATGLALILSNDSAYWKPASSGSCYQEFSLEEGRALPKKMCWGASAGEGTVKGRESPICLQGEYRLTWQPYSRVDAPRWPEFRYAAIWVGPR